MTVHELQHRVSAAELIEWQEMYLIEPFGDIRADLNAAAIQSTMAQIHAPRKDKKPYTPDDFRLRFTSEPKPQGPRRQSAQDIKASLKAWTAMIAK